MTNQSQKLNTPVNFYCNNAVGYVILIPSFCRAEIDKGENKGFVQLAGVFRQTARTYPLCPIKTILDHRVERFLNEVERPQKFKIKSCFLRAFFVFTVKKNMKKESNTKKELLAAFIKTKVVAEACRIAGVTPSAYYFHFYKDKEFRRAVLETRAEQLAERITETA